ncbi:hypothetical protein BTVI_36872 [Pitangus sulphuratus]|nr:hypothetical protein BTVI_36872 [Pitangus sulphuratus]
MRRARRRHRGAPVGLHHLLAKMVDFSKKILRVLPTDSSDQSLCRPLALIGLSLRFRVLQWISIAVHGSGGSCTVCWSLCSQHLLKATPREGVLGVFCEFGVHKYFKACYYLIIPSQDHRVTEYAELEGTDKDH